MSIKNIQEFTDNKYDVCIVGSGPAGMVIASELAQSEKKICVLESGLESTNEYNNSLRKLKNTGEIKIKESSREMVFGGTSTTWGGGSAPLDEIDLSLREFTSYPSKWPFSISELDPYYKRSSQYGFPPLNMFDFQNVSNIESAGDILLKTDKLDKKIFLAVDPPWNFAKKLRHIFSNDNVDLYLDASVLNLGSDNSSLVTHANIISRDGAKNKVYADVFVIAAGGLESTRLLLLSKEVWPNGLGNENDQVGCYLMNHPKNNYGVIKLNSPVNKSPFFFGFFENGIAGFVGIKLSENLQKSIGLLNSYVRFEPIFPWSDNSGVWSFLTIIKKIKFAINFWKKNQKKVVHLRDYNETPDDAGSNGGFYKFSWFKAFYDILINMGMVIKYCFYRLNSNKPLFIKSIRLRNFMEMEPLYENRMTLGSDLDPNGQERAVVSINTSELDKRSVVALHKVLRDELEKNKIGILESNIENEKTWPINFDASHHLGGTRIGVDPKNSVVNSDLRVHGIKNLYVCSGSVFPTSGCANPTYTISALAIRLADFLKKTYNHP